MSIKSSLFPNIKIFITLLGNEQINEYAHILILDQNWRLVRLHI